MIRNRIKCALKGVIGWVVPKRILLWQGGENTNKVALTFDDGPDSEGTPAVLEILSRYQIQATFFLVGMHVKQNPEWVRKIVEARHEIGNHSQSHRVLTKLPYDEWRREIKEGEQILTHLSGRPISLFRPPKGQFSLSMFYYLARRKKTVVLWSIDPKDFAIENEDALWKTLVSAPIRGGDIVLLHDRCLATQTVLPRFIEWVVSKGLQFSTVGALLE